MTPEETSVEVNVDAAAPGTTDKLVITITHENGTTGFQYMGQENPELIMSVMSQMLLKLVEQVIAPESWKDYLKGFQQYAEAHILFAQQKLEGEKKIEESSESSVVSD